MTRFLAVLSGLLLIAAVTIVEPWGAIAVLLAVIAGWWFRSVAVVAVLLALGVLAWADAGAAAAAGTGLVATAYLLNTATLHAPAGVVPTTVASVTGALSFAGAAVLAALLPAQVAWLPLLAPVLVIVLYGLIVAGLTGRRAASNAVDTP
ncbi:hypothetical protein [Nocardia vermiculata]|uniref:Uncharacterized protein n=1 Tax=Nocardia vermiculata TaxID=257274 RepID=A0A846XWD7_9NOCA|nr:hypothetical protein [Nocardia vermiculata]NKY50282.1 hypothetical protein [Nocardia vermiculata]